MGGTTRTRRKQKVMLEKLLHVFTHPNAIVNNLTALNSQVIVSSKASRDASRRRIDHLADKRYNAERDSMQARHERAVRQAKLVPGSLVMVLTEQILGKFKVPKGCSTFSAVVETVFADGRLYMLKAKGALLEQKFPRRSLILVVNEQLRAEIAASELPTPQLLSLEEYLKACWIPPSSTPVCTDKTCRSGCKTTKCPCRLAGHKCGALCHPKYYEKFAQCSNYK